MNKCKKQVFFSQTFYLYNFYIQILTNLFFGIYIYIYKKPKKFKIANFFNKFWNKKSEPAVTPKPKPTAQHPVKYDCVERYTLVNPKNTFGGNVNVWELCKKMPVAYENGENTSGFCECAQLETGVMLPYINALQASSDEDLAKSKFRTVSIIHLTQDKHIYILPVLPICNKKIICYAYFVDDNDTKRSYTFPRGWSFLMTPEIRKAMVNELKVHTR